LDRHEVIAIVVLAVVGLAIAFTALSRTQAGCRYVGGRRGGWDCHHPAPFRNVPAPGRDWR